MILQLTGKAVVLSLRTVMWSEGCPTVDFIILIAKQYLYKQRCLGKVPVFREYRSIVHKTIAIEKFIAIKNHSVAKHNAKWSSNAANPIDNSFVLDN